MEATIPNVTIGWDLGGAHLKAARVDHQGRVEAVVQLACPLWLGLHHLDSAVNEALRVLGPAPLHAVTMTGEMVDLFPDRHQGVGQLVAAMCERFPPATLRFFTVDGSWLGADQAATAGERLASANWVASASLVARRLDHAIFIDIGSTTIDLVPIRDGLIRARGPGDAERLGSGELLYTGVVRTPVMALASRVPWHGDWAPVIPELFATSADIYRICGTLPEGVDLHPTADGADRTPEASARRLARMIGWDSAAAPFEDWRELAAWLAQTQATRLAEACGRLLLRESIPGESPIVGAGVGRFMLPALAKATGRPLVEFAKLLEAHAGQKEKASDCAPAVAVAWLAATAEVPRDQARPSRR